MPEDLTGKVPGTVDEFNEQARAFVQKARAEGRSNVAIANTLDYMITLFQLRQEEDPTQGLSELESEGFGDVFTDLEGEVAGESGAALDQYGDVSFSVPDSKYADELDRVEQAGQDTALPTPMTVDGATKTENINQIPASSLPPVSKEEAREVKERMTQPESSIFRADKQPLLYGKK